VLIEASGTKLDDDGDVSGSPAISLAASCGHGHVVRLLVEAGADVESRDGRDQTPPFLAAMGGNLNIVRLLVEAGADKNARDDDNATPLQKAAERGHANVVQLPVDAGADTEGKDDYIKDLSQLL
jgi:ankyrin repeat protein